MKTALNILYEVHYVHRDKLEVTEFPVDSILGETFVGSEAEARRYAKVCNKTLESRGPPGKCEVVMARSADGYYPVYARV